MHVNIRLASAAGGIDSPGQQPGLAMVAVAWDGLPMAIHAAARWVDAVRTACRQPRSARHDALIIDPVERVSTCCMPARGNQLVDGHTHAHLTMRSCIKCFPLYMSIFG